MKINPRNKDNYNNFTIIFIISLQFTVSYIHDIQQQLGNRNDLSIMFNGSLFPSLPAILVYRGNLRLMLVPRCPRLMMVIFVGGLAVLTVQKKLKFNLHLRKSNIGIAGLSDGMQKTCHFQHLIWRSFPINESLRHVLGVIPPAFLISHVHPQILSSL